ncbi:MAG: sugar transporter substrate-binding protein [Bacteroidetes bacterium]|nr:sugar transporter substrate-binding protein [Bacteroidota bacterium]
MRVHTLPLLFLASALFVAGCGKRESSTSHITTIAVIPKGTTHEFWKSIHAGAVKASRELQVEIIWKGPLREDDREAQISVMEDFVSRGVTGIVLAPLDDIALRGPVANAASSGIPVVIIDSDLKSDDYVSFAATDNYLGGKIGGQELIRLLNGKGRVIMLRCLEGSASTTNREQGWLDAMATAPGITVVSSNQYGGATVETAYRASENLLAPLKDASGNLTIDGIFTPNESTTFGMLRALQDGGHAGRVRFVGFDSSSKLVEALRNKQLNALVLQNPFAMGYVGVKTVVAHLRGEKVEKRIDTGVTLVTPDNMDLPEIKELIQPDLSTWLD